MLRITITGRICAYPLQNEVGEKISLELIELYCSGTQDSFSFIRIVFLGINFPYGILTSLLRLPIFNFLSRESLLPFAISIRKNIIVFLLYDEILSIQNSKIDRNS